MALNFEIAVIYTLETRDSVLPSAEVGLFV
jgi:hypothetical protein